MTGGKAYGGAKYGQAPLSMVTWMSRVDCKGSETYLSDCSFPGWTTSPPGCTHARDASVCCELGCDACAAANATDEDRGVKLNLTNTEPGGTDLPAAGGCGRVEVWKNGQWGTVCGGDTWDNRDAAVVCRQLGLSGGFVNSSLQLPGEGPILDGNVSCQGNERNLSLCVASAPSTVCNHSHDATVCCGPAFAPNPAGVEGEARIVTPSGSNLGGFGCGYVEVYAQGEWGRVCGDMWQDDDALVLCRQLGRSGGAAARVPASTAGSGKIWLSHVQCDGSEKHVWDCPSQKKASATCTDGSHASVCCNQDCGTRACEQPQVSIGPSSCQQVDWLSDSSIRCKVPAGTGQNHPVTVARWDTTFRGKCDSTEVKLAYTSLRVSGIKPPNGGTAGGNTLTIKGTDFGATPPDVLTISIGDRPCNTANWISDSSLECVGTPAGTGSNLPVQVNMTRAGAQEYGVSAVLFNYDAPVIISTQSSQELAILAQQFSQDGVSGMTVSRLSGGSTINIVGKNFGTTLLAAGKQRITIGGKNCTSQEWTSDTTMTCVVPEYTGGGSALGSLCAWYVKIDITIDGRVTSCSQSCTQYYLAYIRDPYELSVTPQFGPTAGGLDITVRGQCFSRAPSTFIPAVNVSAKIGNLSLISARWTTGSSIVGVLPAGSGKLLDVSVDVAGRKGVKPKGFSFDQPIVDSIRPSAGSTSGGQSITFLGRNFGTPTSPLSMFLGGVPCAQSKYIGPTVVVCTTAPCLPPLCTTGGATGLRPAITVDGSVGTVLTTSATLFSYVRPPIVTDWSRNIVWGFSGGNITIRGQRFNTSPVRSVTVGGKPCTRVEFLSDTEVRCQVPPGAGALLTITVSVFPGEGNLYRAFTYYPEWDVTLGLWREPLIWLGAQDPNAFQLYNNGATSVVESWTSNIPRASGPAAMYVFESSNGTKPTRSQGSNGQYFVSFNGAEQYFKSLQPRNSSEMTAFIVAKLPNRPSDSLQRWILSDLNATTQTGVAVSTTTGNSVLKVEDTSDSVTMSEQGGFVGSMQLITIVQGAEGTMIRVNSKNETDKLIASPASPGVSLSPIFIGDGPTGQGTLLGDIYEILIYDKNLSSVSPLAIERVERALCLQKQVSACTSLQVTPGTISWAQPNNANSSDSVALWEGSGVLNLVLQRTGGSDGWGVVFFRISSDNACGTVFGQPGPACGLPGVPASYKYTVENLDCFSQGKCGACAPDDPQRCHGWIQVPRVLVSCLCIL
jgi:hypothetical protein